jgi:hypothetical protein
VLTAVTRPDVFPVQTKTKMEINLEEIFAKDVIGNSLSGTLPFNGVKSSSLLMKSFRVLKLKLMITRNSLKKCETPVIRKVYLLMNN